MTNEELDRKIDDLGAAAKDLPSTISGMNKLISEYRKILKSIYNRGFNEGFESGLKQLELKENDNTN